MGTEGISVRGLVGPPCITAIRPARTATLRRVSEQLIRDCFPVEVYTPSQAPAPYLARVFVTDQRVIVWRETDARTPQLVLDSPHAAGASLPERNRGSFFGQLALSTQDGMVHVTKSNGCGCGASVKALSAPCGW